MTDIGLEKNYTAFYLTSSARRASDLTNPKIVAIDQVALPKGSLWHYVGTEENPLPSPTHPFLRDMTYTLAEHVSEMSFTDTSFIQRVLPKGSFLPTVKNLHKTTPGIKLLRREPTAINDPKTLILESYSLTASFVKYKDKMMSEQVSYADMVKTICGRVTALSKTDRHQFITIDLDERIPSNSAFKKASKKLDKITAEPFKDLGSFFAFTVYQTLGSEGIIYEQLKPYADKVNFIFQHDGRCFILKLKDLLTWALGDELEGNSKEFKLKFIRALVVLTESDDTLEDDDDEETDNKDSKETDDTPDDKGPDAEDEIAKEMELRDKLYEVQETDLDSVEPYQPPVNLVDSYMSRLQEEMVYSPAEIRRFKSLAENQDNIKSPWGGSTIGEFKKIDHEREVIKEEEITYPDNPMVTDKNQLKSSLEVFDKRYIREFFDKDVANVLTSFGGAGVFITDLERENKETISSHLVSYTAKVTIAPGKPSTIRFTFPKLNDQGVMWSGGVKYYMKKQFRDNPIRKIGESRVSLTSYYGKIFVDRSKHAAYSYDMWLTKHVMLVVMDADNSLITKANTSNVFNKKAVVPNDYAVLSKTFSGFTLKTDKGDIQLNFSTGFRDSQTNVPKDHFAIGFLKDSLVTMTMDNVIHVKGQPITTIPLILGLDINKAPTDVAVASVFGKPIPLVIVLGYRLGLSKVLKTLGVKPRKVDKGKSLNLNDDEYVVKFNDQSWIFNRNDRKAALIISGLTYFKKSVTNYDAKLFDKKEVYVAVMNDMGYGRRFLIEVGNIFDMFIDHKTKHLLETINEPTDMVLLFIRAAELLVTHDHPDELDIQYMHFPGYERMAMTLYRELSGAIRSQRIRGGTKQQAIDLNPNAVWMSIFTDTSKEVFGEINPIHSLKQREGVTFGGNGGRDTQTMTKSARAYHPSHRGIISESSPDSGKVGVVVNMPPNPNFTTIRGTVKMYDEVEGDFNKLLSGAALMKPGVEHDDTKRINFVSVQSSHVIPCVGYKPPLLLSGREMVEGHRCDDLFATTAKEPGKVISLNARAIVVELKSGERITVQLGKRYGKESGEVTSHVLVTDLKEGQSFKAGEPIAYNTGFFVNHPYLGLTMKFGTIARTIFIESPDNFEDSVFIHRRFAETVKSTGVEVRNIMVNADHVVSNMVKVGDKVSAEDTLAIIYEGGTAEPIDPDNKVSEIFRRVGASSPRARKAGEITRVEVYYRCELDDMEDSLAELVQFYEAHMMRERRALGLPKISAKVGDDFRTEGKTLSNNQIIFKVFIEYEKSCGLGDKLVFGPQMKCTINDTLTGIFETKDGQPLDAGFSYKSVGNRIVKAIILQGMGNTVNRALAEDALSIYLNGEE